MDCNVPTHVLQNIPLFEFEFLVVIHIYKVIQNKPQSFCHNFIEYRRIFKSPSTAVTLK